MLRKRRALLVHEGLRAVRVDGPDARAWLHDLVTADVASLPTGALRPALLLTPTGRIRAAFAIACAPEGLLLLQEPDQPDIAELLAPYVLSATVTLGRDDRVFVSVPEAGSGSSIWRPSLLPLRAPGGALVAVAAEDLARLRERSTSAGIAEATPADADRLRVEEGVARFPTDLDETSLPAEAGWEDRIDATKGCFLGQESVAKVRNLGHPPRVVRPFASAAPVAVGEDVVADDAVVGTITSSVPTGGGGRCIARVAWAAREAPLATAAGVRLRPT